MSRAQIKVDVGDTLTIEGTAYRVAEHPALPGIPYVQRGARGFVIQLIASNGERMALKYFKLRYRVPELVDIMEALKQYADLPGLRAARRTVFTKATHPDLLVRYPALEYGVLMPWLPGVTWYDVVTTKTPLAPRDSLKIAQATSTILATLESRGLAHCDIAGANVMVERKTAQIELVDIEEMYGLALPQPVDLPAGQDGYQHRTSRAQGQWNAEGDRFGAAVLLAEMLGWADGRVRQNSADEHYFSAAEMQDSDSPRYRLLSEVLRDEYASPVAEAFEQAWHSVTLADCPPISVWRDTLATLQVEAKSPQPMTSPVVVGRRSVGGTQPANANAERPPDRLHLEGTRLCRNCGAQNAATDSFCKRCGFYIGTGVRRPPQPIVQPADSQATASNSPIATRTQPAAVSNNPVAPVIGTGPQTVPLQYDSQEIISARRFSGQETRRFEPPTKAGEDGESAMGPWIVVAIVLGVLITVMLLTLAGAH